MKKKSNSSNAVTTPILRKELTKMKGELKRELKTELRQELGADMDKKFDMAERVFRAEVQTSFSEAKEELKGFITEATDKILTRIDPFLQIRFPSCGLEWMTTTSR